MAIDPNLKESAEGAEEVPDFVLIDLPFANVPPVNNGAGGGGVQQQQQPIGGMGLADLSGGLSALKSAIGAIGDAMAELAETSAQCFRQSDGGKAEDSSTGVIEEVVENVALIGTSDVGMAEGGEAEKWEHHHFVGNTRGPQQQQGLTLNSSRVNANVSEPAVEEGIKREDGAETMAEV